MQMLLDLFIKIYLNQNCIFSLLFFNQDFFLTIVSITLFFGDLVDNVQPNTFALPLNEIYYGFDSPSPFLIHHRCMNSCAFTT